MRNARAALASSQIASRWKKAPEAPIQSPLSLDSFHYKKERKAELCAALIKLGSEAAADELRRRQSGCEVRTSRNMEDGMIERNTVVSGRFGNEGSKLVFVENRSCMRVERRNRKLSM